jgi:hypothetical protein
MKFISPYKKYKLWIDPAHYTTDGMGRRTYHTGVVAKFENGAYETEDKTIIDAMLKEAMCGIDYAPVKIDTQSTIPTPELASPSPSNYAWAKTPEATPQGNPGFVCEICGKTCKTKLALAGHMRSHQTKK